MLKSSSLFRTRIGIPLGLLVSIISGFLYLRVLHAPSSLFYLFAGLAFILGPIIAGTVDAIISPSHKLRIFLASGGVVFGSVFVLFFLIYAILIRLSTTKVYLPSYCDGTYAPGKIPADLEYSLPDKTKGILVNSDDRIAVVARIDYEHSPHPSALFLVNEASGDVLLRTDFPDDNIAVAIDNGTVYLFNKGIGFFVDGLTGEPENYLLTMDTYGTNDRGYFETTGVISSWSRDGSVRSLQHLSFNGIVRGCYISATTQEVVQLK